MNTKREETKSDWYQYKCRECRETSTARYQDIQQPYTIRYGYTTNSRMETETRTKIKCTGCQFVTQWDGGLKEQLKAGTIKLVKDSTLGPD